MKQTSLGRNAFLNAIKQACTVIFPFITFSYSIRILGKDNIGMLNFSQSIVNYAALIAALGINNYGAREGAMYRADEDRLGVFINQLFSINLITTALACILLFVVTSYSDKVRPYALIILIQAFGIVLSAIGVDWLNIVFEDYLYLTLRYLIIQVISLGALFVFVREPGDLYDYCIISVLSSYGGNILNWFYIRKKVKIRPTIHMNWRTHIKPLLILFFNGIATTIYLNSDITMLGVMCNNEAVGVYSTSTKIYSISKTLVNALIMVTVPRFSSLIGKGNLSEYRQLLGKTFNSVLALLLPMLVGLLFEAHNIIIFVAGEQYLDGVTSLRILSIALIFAVFSCFFAYSIMMPNKNEKLFMYSTMSAAFVNILLNFFFIPQYGMNGAAVTTLIAEIIVFLMLLYFSRGIYRARVNPRDLISIISGSVIIAIICMVCNSLPVNVYVQLFGAIIFSIILYVLVLVLFKHSIAYKYAIGKNNKILRKLMKKV